MSDADRVAELRALNEALFAPSLKLTPVVRSEFDVSRTSSQFSPGIRVETLQGYWVQLALPAAIGGEKVTISQSAVGGFWASSDSFAERPITGQDRELPEAATYVEGDPLRVWQAWIPADQLPDDQPFLLALPTDSEQGVDVAHLDIRHNNVTLDLCQGASYDSVADTEALASFAFATMAVFFLIVWAAIGGFPPTSELLLLVWGGLYMVLLFPFITGIIFPNVVLRRTPPIRLHRQRREVAFVVERSGERFWLPAPTNMWFAAIAGTIAMPTGFYAVWSIAEFLRLGVEETFPLKILLLHITSLVFLPLYPYFYDFCRKL